jgi:hypothetical protein
MWINGFHVVLEQTEWGWEASVIEVPTVHATGLTREHAIETVRAELVERRAPNPYLAVAGAFADDPFGDEVDAFICAERQRERDAAAAEADA